MSLHHQTLFGLKNNLKCYEVTKFQILSIFGKKIAIFDIYILINFIKQLSISNT